MAFNSSSFSNPTVFGAFSAAPAQNSFIQSFNINGPNNINVLQTTPELITSQGQYFPSAPIRSQGQIGLTSEFRTSYNPGTARGLPSYANQFYTNNQYAHSAPAQLHIGQTSGVTTPYNSVFPTVGCQYQAPNNNQSGLVEVTVTTKFLTTASTANRLLSFPNSISQGNVTPNSSNSSQFLQSLPNNSYNNPQNYVVPNNHQSTMSNTSNSNSNPTTNNHVNLNPVSPASHTQNQNAINSNSVPRVQRVYDLASLLDVSAYNKSVATQEALNPEPLNVVRPRKRARYDAGANSSQADGETSNQIIAAGGYGSHDNVLGLDGRLHSLPHPKYGPYTCPICMKVFIVAQHFAAHVWSHYSRENPRQRMARMMARKGEGNLLMTNTTEGGAERGAIVPWEGGAAVPGESSAACGGSGTGGVIVSAGGGASSSGVQIKEEPSFAPFN